MYKLGVSVIGSVFAIGPFLHGSDEIRNLYPPPLLQKKRIVIQDKVLPILETNHFSVYVFLFILYPLEKRYMMFSLAVLAVPIGPDSDFGL